MGISLLEKILEAVGFIKERITEEYKIGIILGTGLNKLVDEVKISTIIDYKDIPHFPVSTVSSHQSKLIFGTINNKPVVMMAGRFHYYEGHTMEQVTFGIRVLKYLGVEVLLISNVTGGLNETFEVGDVVVVKDHINLHPENPLRGFNDERIGPRFPDMTDAYDIELRIMALRILKENNITHHEGVYAGLQGPNLETPAESNFLHLIGGDIVGMSTVPEVIIARHMDMRTFVASIVSNKCFPLNSIKKTTIESVIEVANLAEPKLGILFKEMVKSIEL